ncbi:MAG: SURF1 family protein [Gammaproteobacteria bacterium]|nr:SURF1 family protein [Gammaproteobacteria bacterium]
MSIQIGDFRFTPSVLPTIAGGSLLVLFLSLGNWQLDRADEKRTILQTYQQRIQQTAGELSLPIIEPEQWRYRKVRLSGRFDNERQLLLDNQVSRGQVGLNVLTPFKLRYQEQIVLIDRGWLPLGNDRSQLPDIKVTAEVVTLEGTIYTPYKKGLRLGELDERNAHSWPRLIQYLDFDEISQRLGYPIAPLTIRLDPASSLGYHREWPPIPITPDTHTAYAIQWFTLAGVLIIIYLTLSLKRNNASV